MINSNRIWILVCSFASIGILLGGWFIGVAPMLGATTTADADRVSVEAQNAAQEVNLVALEARFDDIGRLKSELKELEPSIPAEADLADFVRAVNTSISTAGVALISFESSDASAFAPAVPAAAAAPAPAPATGEAVADAPVAAESAPVAADGGVLDAELAADSVAAASAGLVSIPIGLSVGGSYEQVLDFAKSLQSGSRLFLLSDLSIGEGSDDYAFSMTVSGFIYVLAPVSAPAPSPIAAPVAGTEAMGTAN